MGSDTVIFSGAFSTYHIGYNEISYSYTVSGATIGIDIIFGVEFFQFSDGVRSAGQLFGGDTTAPTVVISDNIPGTATGNITYSLVFERNRHRSGGQRLHDHQRQCAQCRGLQMQTTPS